jgi:transposase
MPRWHLRVEELSQIIVFLCEGYSQREVAQVLNNNKSVVQRTASRHRSTGCFNRKRGQGANRKSTTKEDDYTGCRKINVFQLGGLVGKNLRNLEKIK